MISKVIDPVLRLLNEAEFDEKYSWVPKTSLKSVRVASRRNCGSNPNPEYGLSSSLKLALEVRDVDAAVIFLVICPWLMKTPSQR